MVDPTMTKRLHVGGLTPAITAQHIKERFSSFGTVTNVEELKPDAFGQPRPFTFLTLETTPAQLKKCLNILSGSFWRGTQLRLAEAKPDYTTRYNPPDLSAEETKRQLDKKRKRVESKCGEDMGKLAQDQRLVTRDLAIKKTFWVVNEDDGRVVRPLAIRPSHPLSKPAKIVSKKENKDKKRVGISGPPKRLRRRVINPIIYGSVYITPKEFDKGLSEEAKGLDPSEEGVWQYEDMEVEDEEDIEEDSQVVMGIWRKTNATGEVVEEQLVRGKKRRVITPEEDIYEYNFADRGSPNRDQSSSPLFGKRDLPAEQAREESPLFPTRDDEISSAKPSQETQPEEEQTSQGGSSPLFPSRAPLEQNARSLSPLFPTRSSQPGEEESTPTSPLFPSRDAPVMQTSQPSSPLFPDRPGEVDDDAISQVAQDDAAQSDYLAQRSSSPLFPARKAKSPSPSPTPISRKTQKLTGNTKPSVPDQILASARAERSSALGVLGSLIGDLSPPAKKEKVVWEVFSESDDDDEVEIARGRSTSTTDEDSYPVTGPKFDILDEERQAPYVDVPINEAPVDASTSGSGSSESSSSSSSSGSSGEKDENMDVDGQNSEGNEASSSGSGSSSSSSGSGSGSGDDDDESEDDDSDDSTSDSSETDSDTESDEEESDSAEDEEGESPEKPDLAPTQQVEPKSNGLKDMFAPQTTSSLNFGSTSNDGVGGGFSLMANFGEDIELDEDFDVPLPILEETSAGQADENGDVALEPLQLLSMSSGRGKVKFDASSAADSPLFFTFPTDAGSTSMATDGRKGESRNLFNELHTGVPILREDENGEEVLDHSILPPFSRQPGETDESMKTKWENEKLELTQGWKKKHREAKKSKRRRGGDDVE
ncbi:uncharacterized protein I303_100899 [Kwoniella dejecticola CBS 10117]|uniref:RRM domain-containing protein n=1 Tax=Kwoniella dejecticola CBS 10117 TaxID=1296121 RepID=A0A1A6AGB0_9TREE|nr:uncharacterized protein I303_00903 [Kwoniella dejecticola CBS 10117]OBR89081.1 hypothetical protein I303_00903 [Kwoniella dejecticola CBS 10117]